MVVGYVFPRFAIPGTMCGVGRQKQVDALCSVFDVLGRALVFEVRG